MLTAISFHGRRATAPSNRAGLRLNPTPDRGRAQFGGVRGRVAFIEPPKFIFRYVLGEIGVHTDEVTH
jgi:hypothetical protein